MTTVEEALTYWRTQLSISARRSLVLDWTDRLRTVAFEVSPSASLAALLRGHTVSWADLAAEAGIPDGSRIDPVLERSDEAFRERGNPGLNVVLGTAVIPGLDGEMPLVMLPIVARRRARRLPEIDVEVAGPLTVCPSTVETLAHDFAVRIDPDLSSPTALLASLAGLAAITGLPEGIALSTRGGIAVQASNWLDVQHDLEQFEAAKDSLLIRAIAGDMSARQEVRRPDEVEPDGPGSLVLPADASQRDVLRRVRRGSTMIVEGPPGTGKSQTIANLLAAAIVDGRSVLFVAQKRAAVDVVVGRLREAGLDHLVLDVHDDTARFQPVAVHADPTGPVRLLPARVDVPTLDEAGRHGEAVRAAWPILGDLMRRGGDAIPDLDDGIVDGIVDRVDIFRVALNSIASARASLAALGYSTTSRVLRLLLGRTVELGSAAEALEMLPASTASVAAAMGCASSARSVAQIVQQIRADAVVPTATTATDQLVNALYRGDYYDVNSRRAIVSSFLVSADALRKAGLVGPTTLVRDLAVMTRDPGWAALAALPSEAISSVHRTDDPRIVLSRETPATAAVVIRRIAESGSRMPTGANEVLAELDVHGLLDLFVDDPDPSGLFSASIAEAMVRRMPLMKAVDVATAAASAAAQFESAQIVNRQRISAIAHQRRLDHVASPDHVDSLLTYEGLVRHARTRKVRNSEVLASATPTALAFFPIVVSSPTGAARSLPRTAELFDLVVFDEASQLETAVAVSSLARARQAVVFGDSLQLPPDRFFQGSGPSMPDAVLSQTSLLDSVATLLTGTDRTAYLRWHYRSVDGRLVRFVNDAAALYAGRMTLVPAPPSDVDPIRLVLTESSSMAHTVGDVLAAVDPGHTTAVVTFGLELADRLSVALSLPMSPDESEPVVVRNIESFQGDERDHIILVLPSVSAGSTALQTLGPINQAGGERRLNVALTRARQRLTVVSCFDHTALAGAQTPGAQLLRDFLRHLTTGRREEFIPSTAGLVRSDPIGVIEGRLLSAGLDVWRPGTAHGYVPLIVRRADGVFVVIDVDTPVASELDPLDRELLLPAELERRGWRRVRSTVRDWIERPETMVAEVVSAAGGVVR